jgi:hypothetical protein
MKPLTDERAGALRAGRNNRLFVPYIILATHRVEGNGEAGAPAIFACRQVAW